MSGPTAPAPVDEMVDGRGGLRRAWRGIVEPVLTLGPGQLARRDAALRRVASEEGAGWHCDPVPLPMEGGEFRAIAAGLAQRATLIERVLADIYGAQALLASGALPPSLVFGSRNFIRSARMATPSPVRRLLHLYAADLVRGPDGAWRVVADRCAKPSGIAAVLENRRMLRRVVPELFGAPVEALRAFFEDWRDALGSALTPGGSAALLTDGRGSFGPHEPGLLARELGCHLVHGSDLTLRAGRLSVKTLRGLRPVDILLNRQPARLLDPLELDWDNGAGVPGLMAAMRGGGVQIANDPGAALGGDPGIAAWLPRLAPVLLGEALALPAAELLWLGEPEARARVLADPAAWSFAAAHDAEIQPVGFEALSPGGQEKLLAAISGRPNRLVALRPPQRSVMPALVGGGLEPREVVLRLFLRGDASGWTALPGGLVRAGGVTKDLFVLAHGDAGAITHRMPIPPPSRAPAMAIRRVEADLPARRAEHFFDLGARLERLETGARRLRALALRLGRYTERPQELVELRIAAASLGPVGWLPADALIDPAAPGLRTALARLTRPGSPLAGATAQYAGAIDAVGDQLSGEMLSVLHLGLAETRDLFAGGGAVENSLDGAVHLANRLQALTATFAGIAAETMVRGGGWLFFDIGLRLARAQGLAALLGACFGAAARLPSRGGEGAIDTETALAILLELGQSVVTYRARYGARLEAAAVLDLVVADDGNPRSLHHQLAALRADFERLREVGGAEFAAVAARMGGEADALVARVVGADHAVDPAAGLRSVPDAAARLIREIEHCGSRIRRRYFTLLPEMRTLAT